MIERTPQVVQRLLQEGGVHSQGNQNRGVYRGVHSKAVEGY